MIRKPRILVLFAVIGILNSVGWAQSSLTLSSATGTSGTLVPLALSLASPLGSTSAALQWGFTYPQSSVTSFNITAAPALASAGMTLTCAPNTTGTACVLYGMNLTTIPDGPVATANVVMAPSVTSLAIGVSGTVGSTADGNPVTVTGIGGTITPPASPTGLSSLTCNPTTVSPSGSTTCTLGVSGAGGATVTLASNNANLTVPPTVVVPANSATATFQATATAFTTSQTATLTATLNGNTQSAAISLAAASTLSVSAFQCASGSLLSGSTTICTATLSQLAPAGGVNVAIANSAASVLTAPASLAVSAGSTSGAIWVSTKTIASNQTATLTASLNGSSQSATISLLVNSTGISLQCGAASLTSNTSTTCTVTLTPPPASATTVVIANTATAALSVPSSVNLAAGAATGTFTASAGNIASSQTATLTALLTNAVASTTIALLPASGSNAVSSLQCGSASLGPNGSTTCTVTLASPASSGVTVTIGNTAAAALTVPGSVNVAQGSATATFTATAGNISSDQTATLTASLGGSSAAATIALVSSNTVTSLQCGVTSLLSNASGTCTVTVTRPAGAGGLTVTITDTVPSVLTVPGSVNVSAGASSATFQVSTGFVATDQNATITASLSGSSATANLLLVAPNAVSSLQCAAGSLNSNASTACTVTLNKAAVTGGVTVAIANSASGVLTVPGSVNVSQGASSATFTAAAGTIASNQTATLTASLNGSSSSTSISLLAPATQISVAALQCSASSLNSNTSALCTVTLSQQAPANGVTGTLSNTAPALLTAPATWNVPAGQSASSFSVSAGAVPAPQSVTLTASLNNSSASATISLTGPASLSLQCESTTLSGNSSTSCTVSASTPAPAGGATVSLTATSASVTVPSSVTIAAGATSAMFTLGTKPTSSPLTVILIATLGNSTTSVTLSILPSAGGNSLASFTCYLTTISIPSSGTCYLDLSNPGSARAVAITSSSPSITVPASVPIGPGARSLSFPFTGTTANVSGIAITATLGTNSLVAVWSISYAPGTGVGQSVTLTCVPKHVTAGRNTTCQVRTDTPAGTDREVEISSSSASVRVPGSVHTGTSARSMRFTVTADDSAVLASADITVRLGSESATYSLAVLPADSPSLHAPRELTVKAGSPARFSVQATDAGGAPLSVSAAGLPDSARFDNATGAFDWTPGTPDLGTHEITFTSARPAGQPLTRTVNLTVTDGAPILRALRNGAGEGAPEACSPGAVATLLGHFLANSADTAIDPSGSATSLGGTRVRINGEYALLTAASSDRVSFLCPASATSGQIEMAVETSSGVSNTLLKPVWDTAPGIFSVDGSGRGQALAALATSGELAAVSDYRASGTPVLPGDTIAVRTTGIGCSSTSALPNLQIGAGNAKVLSVAPSETAGVCLISAEVPSGVSGDQVPVTIESLRGDGSTVRSNTVTIAVDVKN